MRVRQNYCPFCFDVTCTPIFIHFIKQYIAWVPSNHKKSRLVSVGTKSSLLFSPFLQMLQGWDFQQSSTTCFNLVRTQFVLCSCFSVLIWLHLVWFLYHYFILFLKSFRNQNFADRPHSQHLHSAETSNCVAAFFCCLLVFAGSNSICVVIDTNPGTICMRHLSYGAWLMRLQYMHTFHKHSTCRAVVLDRHVWAGLQHGHIDMWRAHNI